jgi:hypothetical protein
MALVFRTDQTTPLTNDQVDNNFKYLNDQIGLKYSISNFTSANISATLRTTGVNQSTLQLAQNNAINAWLVRDMAPFTGLPSSGDKTSLVSRDTYGNITVGQVTGELNGNASTASIATIAIRLQSDRTINGQVFNGTSDISILDSSKLPTSGGTLTGKLTLAPAQVSYASLNLGSNNSGPSDGQKVNGDFWATTSGIFYHIQSQTNQVSPLASPTFTGIPRAPGYDGNASQIITLSHLDTAVSTINSSINTKAPILSPAFTGIPTAPAPGNTTAQIATLTHLSNSVASQAATTETAYKSYTNAAVLTQTNAINVLLAAKAALDSPQLAGTPTAPTPVITDNSTRLATTAFTVSSIAGLRNVLDGAVAALQNAIATTRPVPAGSVFYMAGSVVPNGYLEANGQAVNRNTYPDLWAALGYQTMVGPGLEFLFQLPDLRGEFVRGWDHERGVDTNRELKSLQYSQNLEHNHGSAGDDQLSFGAGVGGWPGTSRGSFTYDATSKYAGSSQIWNTTTDGGNESRPRNVALMPIIKW